MRPEIKETAVNNPSCEIRLGLSSWDLNSKSVKYTWFDANGKAMRGGEFPVEALPQMMRMALENKYLDSSDVFKN